MSPSALELFKTMRRCGVELHVDGDSLRYRAPHRVLTPELRAELQSFKAELTALLTALSEDQQALLGEDGEITAVLLFSARLDTHCWLILDDTALDEHRDIILSDFPIFFPEELARLDGKDPAELEAILKVKQVFPRGGVVQ